MTFTIGLTGGIGCGKSSAARLFAELGAGMIDTDQIARELTAPGQPALAAIRRHFGAACFLPDGTVDRACLRRRVFSDPAARAQLEAILHPLIRQEVEKRAGRSAAPYLLIVVPLLLETRQYRELVQRVLVIDCAEEAQVARTMQRSGLSAAEVRAIMACQLPREERLCQANDVLHNDGDQESLRQQVEKLHARYLDLAAAGRPIRNCQISHNRSE